MAIRIAAAQMPVTADIDANLATILRVLEFAAGERAELLLTPEGSLSGYTHRFDRAHAAAALAEVTRAAADAGVGLALGTCFEEPDGRCYNQIRFHDPDGTYLGFHAKTLTCGSLTDPPRGEIEHFAVAPLRTFRLAGVTLGGLICNDLWANPGCTPQDDPHLTQRLSRLGARVIVHAVNGGRGGPDAELNQRYHEASLRLRAAAAGVWIVTVDNSAPAHLPCSSPSGLIDPRGEWRYQAPAMGEHVFVVEVEV